jgi:hypothetical protein
MYVCGYFIMPTDVAKDWGFGFEQMNLNALLNPMGQSTFLKSRDIRGMLQIEGFMYIGFGAVLLIPGLFFPKGWTIRDRLATPYSIFSLYIVLMFAMAILPQIAFDNSVLFNVPEFVRNVHIFNIFRANSRMFWAAYYILLLYLFLRVATADIPYKTKVLWLFIALCIQWADIQPMVKKSSEDFAKNTGTVLPKLASPVWTAAAQRYKAIKMVPQQWRDLYLIKNVDYLILGNFAVYHGMTINAGRLGRYDKEKLRAEELQQISDLQHGHLDKDSLYVVIDKSLLLSADIPEAITGLGTADGYCVVAPNWFVGKSANLGLIPAKTAPFAPLAVGHIINFSDPNSRAYLGPGWHPSEQFGVWSAETTAVIRLQTLGNARFLKINGHVPPNSKKAPPFIIVAVNGITTMPLSHTNDNDLLVKLPQCQPSGSCRYRVEIHTPLVFTPPGPEGFDMRYIGFGLVSIALVK